MILGTSLRLFSATYLGIAFLLSGCATNPSATVQTKVIEKLWSSPVRVTHFPLSSGVYSSVQSAAGYIWATRLNYFSFTIVKIDPKSNEVAEFSRPRSDEPKFLVDEQSMWYSDGMAIRKVDIATNQVMATIERVGIPFALGDGAVWAYNNENQVVSGIDANTSQIRTQFPTHGRPYHPGSFAFGAGSIWQYAFSGDVSWWDANGRDWTNASHVLPTVVRRINPYTKKIIAEIPIGPTTAFLDPDVPKERIHFVAGGIWVLAKSASSSVTNPGHVNPYAKRIDVETNMVTATISLRSTAAMFPCGGSREPQTPVFFQGRVWVSVHCGRARSALFKIDLRTNQIVGEFGFYAPGVFEPDGMFRGTGFILSHPLLVATDDSLWGRRDRVEL